MGSQPSVQHYSQEQLLEHLEQSPFGAILQDTELSEFLKCWSPCTARQGELLPTNAGETYFICEGEIDVSTILPAVKEDKSSKATEGVHVDLCTKRRGQLLNLAVTVANALETANYANARLKRQATKLVSKIETTTMTCVSSHCELLLLNRIELARFTSNHPETGKKLQSVLSSDLIDYLKNVPFLKELPTSKLILFSKMCTYQSFQPGQDVFRENDPGTSMSICLFGKFEISVAIEATSPNNANVEEGLRGVVNKFAQVNPGDFFGEMSLIIEMRRLATVTAVEKSLVITVDKTNFCNFIKVVPELNLQLRADVQKRMMEKLHACKIPFFSNIELEKLLSMNEYCKIVEAAPNEVIIEQGQPSSSFYMIVCGSCRIEVLSKEEDLSTGATPKKILVNTSGPGAYFGELSMILNEETHATVTANEQSVLLSISPEHFPLFFAGNSVAMAEVRIRMGGERASLRHFITHPIGRKTFLDHLHREHSEEHLMLYDAILKHENELEVDEDDCPRNNWLKDSRIQNIESIYQQFIKDGSPQEVNIPATMKKEIASEIESKSGSIGCFSHIKNEIFKVMEKDNFVRFKKSAEYKAFLEEIGGAYTGIPKKVVDSRRLSIQMKRRII